MRGKHYTRPLSFSFVLNCLLQVFIVWGVWLPIFVFVTPGEEVGDRCLVILVGIGTSSTRAFQLVMNSDEQG